MGYPPLPDKETESICGSIPNDVACLETQG